MSNNKLWVEKYRPKSLQQYIFQDEHQKQSINHMIEQQEIPHLLLVGGAGTGKTTLAKILINACGVDETDVLYLNGSDENGVDDIRNKVKEFASTFAFGSFKIVFIDEADYLSQPAQGTLRNVMEEYSESVRFIMTGNYVHKITPPIKSRCQTYTFKSMDKIDITEYCATILVSEKIKFDLETLDTIVAYGYPDVRKIVNTLQQYSMSGKLQLPKVVEGNDDWKFKLLDLLQENKWNEIRLLLCNSIENEEWIEVYRFLYQNLDKSKKFSEKSIWEEGIIIISEHLYQHSVVADADINAAAMFIRLGQL